MARNSLDFCMLLDIQIGHLPIKYLEIPLVAGSHKYVHFNELIDKASQ